MTETTLAPLTIDEVRSKLEERRARLEELAARLNAIPVTVEKHRKAMARAIAAGESEGIAKRHQIRAREAEGEEEALTEAVRLVRAEIEGLEAELRPLVTAEREDEADRTRDAHTAVLDDALTVALDALGTLEPLLEEASRTYREALQARRDAMRAAGAEAYDVLHAQIIPDGYTEPLGMGSGELHHRLREIARAMIKLSDRYGPAKGKT